MIRKQESIFTINASKKFFLTYKHSDYFAETLKFISTIEWVEKMNGVAIIENISEQNNNIKLQTY